MRDATAIAEFDSQVWREERNQLLYQWVQDENAVVWLLDYCQVCEVFDDLVDKDKPVEDRELTDILHTVFVRMPLNPFFERYKLQLCPVVAVGINSWLDANWLEKSGKHTDRVRAFTLRDRYMDVLTVILEITRGWEWLREHSLEIRAFFSHSESFAEYDSALNPPET